MSIIKFPYHNDFVIEVAMHKLHKVTFTLIPENWQNYNPLVNLEWNVVEFNDANHTAMPSIGGVYTFVVVPGVANHPRCAHPIYVGETADFHERYRDYLNDRTSRYARPKVKLMFGLWSGYLLYCYAKIDDTTLIHTVQDNLIRALDPVINKMFPKDVQATVTAASL